MAWRDDGSGARETTVMARTTTTSQSESWLGVGLGLGREGRGRDALEQERGGFEAKWGRTDLDCLLDERYFPMKCEQSGTDITFHLLQF